MSIFFKFYIIYITIILLSKYVYNLMILMIIEVYLEMQLDVFLQILREEV